MRVLGLIAAFSLAACGATLSRTPPPDPSPTVIGNGTVPSNEILVYRSDTVAQAANIVATPVILLDGRSIGTCRIGQPILIRVPSGTWTITALTASGEVSQEVVVRENVRASLRCGTALGTSLNPAPTLTRVDTETALAESGL